MTPATKVEPPSRAAAEAPAPDRGGGDFDPIHIDLSAFPSPIKPKTRRYWVGVRKDAPFDQDSRGGVAFMKWSGKPQYDSRGAIENPESVRGGMTLELTDDQIKIMKERIANTVLRVSRDDKGAVQQVKRHMRDHKFYAPQEIDEPLGRYLYCVPIRDGALAENWRDVTPVCMVE
jgi:hypothetical protein